MLSPLINLSGGLPVVRSTLSRGIVLALLLSAYTCLPVLAESIPRSINEIVSLAIKHNADLAAFEKEVAAKQSLAVQAGTISNPTLELQGITGTLTGSPEERSVSIGVNQEFPLNGKLRLRREAGQHEAEVVQRQRGNIARLLRDEVATLVLELVLADKKRELAAGQVALNQELVRVSEERFKAGDIPELERNLARVEQARAESRLLEVERERIPLRIKIASMTGLKENDFKLPDNLTIPKLPINTPELIKKSLTSRPDLMALMREHDKTVTETRLAGAEAIPNLTAGFFVQWQRSSTEVGSMSSTSSNTLLGLRLSIPIPVFDQNQGGRAAAKARMNAASSRRLALERSIIAEVETAASRLSSSEKILEQFEKSIIPQLTENLKLTQEAYRIGEVGILSVIDEQKKFFEVNDGYLSAQHSRRAAFLKLETAVATDLTGGVQ
jgi:cobalt-zinc-cadmium efflux system outer membrane protein